MIRSMAIACATLLALGLFGCDQRDVPGQAAADGASSSGATKPAPPPMAALPPAKVAAGAPAAVRAAPKPLGVAANPPAQYALDDEEVLWRVMTALGALPGAPAESLAVTVSSGVVTLGGEVRNPERRGQIVQLVSRVKGVQSVVDKLRVAES
ncbi:MAG TPA: BON domain-containing protein [Burkholderiales bacterium]|nr:BON domain-containing protein [Burkholderiales bacterium]